MAGRTVTEAAAKYAREVLRVSDLPEFEAVPEYEDRLEVFLGGKWVPAYPSRISRLMQTSWDLGLHLSRVAP